MIITEGDPIAANFTGDYEAIPELTKGSLISWALYGQPVGGFLENVLMNDLMNAFAVADDENRDAMYLIVKWIYNHLPMDARFRLGYEAKELGRANLQAWKGVMKRPAVDSE